MADSSPGPSSRSYVVPCPRDFRDRVTAAAAERGASPADLARAALLLAGEDRVRAWPDPGEPARGERETVVIKSGASKDRALRRKPRLQVRLPEGVEIPMIRKALALALALETGEAALRVEPKRGGLEERYAALEEEVVRAREAIQTLSPPEINRIDTVADALHVMGFPPYAQPTPDGLRGRYRDLAKILHPDAPFGDNARMGLVNDAFRILRNQRL